jgi:hypothetical protein
MTPALTIPLEPSERPEPFELADRNMIQARVQLPDRTVVSDPGFIIELNLSRDAMVGLATELLRAAHKHEASTGWEMHPIDRDLASQCLGVFLHPNSCRLNIWHVELGTVAEALR